MQSLRAYLNTLRTSHPRSSKLTLRAVVALQTLCAVHLFFEYVGGPRIVSGPSMLPTLGPGYEYVIEDTLSPRLATLFAPSPYSPRRGQGQGIMKSFMAMLGVDGMGMEGWKLKRGDIVVVRSPVDPRMVICKRVLGLEGDIVALDPLAPQTPRPQGSIPESPSSGIESIPSSPASPILQFVPRRFQNIFSVTPSSPSSPSSTLAPMPMQSPSPSSLTQPTHILIPPGHIWLTGDNTSMSRDSRLYGPVSVALVRGVVRARIWPNPCIFEDPMTWID
ncbi:LexA/Signal peptidase [Sistotremastrum suecicum HHB10207 ss-3]|uniref:LexA/Signal peptidase n=1 Tax=Sistotremastrum suecicum HHB10207 ss-3 TaxID=1314776 RepID=A0A165Y9F1_9AGAM|nr:LexA/Signal peptidase [Sistotremastrum suecicum HHB10207 ss-3]